MFENLVFPELTRWFYARGERPAIDLVRTKDGVEVDLLVHLGSGRAVAIEAKSSYEGFTQAQHRLFDSLGSELAAFGLPELFGRLQALSPG